MTQTTPSVPSAPMAGPRTRRVVAAVVAGVAAGTVLAVAVADDPGPAPVRSAVTTDDDLRRLVNEGHVPAATLDDALGPRPFVDRGEVPSGILE